MFKQFIVATDLSPASYAVVSCLGMLKTYGADRCLLLQCLSFGEVASTAFSYRTEPLEKMLEEQRALLEKQGFTVETRTVSGAPKKEIVRLANTEGYDLIVIGTQGHSAAEDKLLGGVAYGVINNSTTPVLTVPVSKNKDIEIACETMAPCRFGDHVLFATDFSPIADSAFTFVEQLVSLGSTQVTLVHVQDKIRMENASAEQIQKYEAQDRERLKNLQQRLLQRGVPQVDLVLCCGVPQQEILRLVRERQAQLVIMGRQGRGFFGEFFLGSVSHHLARSSPVPVLLIPGPGSQ